ncbi:MAG: DUF1634 domain-containing protein [Anaerolineae bacterium]|nr:DUF1634 domain-containing protein [Phycisphaerae bacterium]
MNQPQPARSKIEAADTMPAPAEAVPIINDLTTPHGRALGRVEGVISTVLRVGVIISISVIFIGMIISFARNPQAVRDPQQLAVLTSKDAPFPHSLKDVMNGVLALQGQAIMALGLLILIATPVMRVAVSIVAFARQRDTVYLAITSTVLALLILSFLLGRISH